MKAIQMHATGGPEVLQFVEIPTPSPKAGELLIRVAVAGVNYADIGMRMGMFHGPQTMPVIPGFEVTGTVAAVGADVTGFHEGDRVAAVLDAGGYAEYAVADPQKTFPLPDDIDFAAATALCIQGPTAYGVLYDAGRFQSGDAVLVQAAAGGVGSLAVQLAKLGGARTVIGTASTPEKRALITELGADAAIDYTQPNWTDQVRAATGGRGVDVLLESVGGTLGAQAYGTLAPLGRIVVFGSASGRPAPPDMMQMNMLGLSISGFGGPWLRPGRAQAARAAIITAMQAGTLRVVPGPSFPLEDAAKPQEAISGRETTGKVTLHVM